MAVTFGKRNPRSAADYFRNEGAAFARDIGLKIGGPDGAFRSESDDKERVARAYAELQRRTKEVNQFLAPLVGPECQMLPFYLIPESCWIGETGQYLVGFLGLTAYGPWNVAFLPGNQWTAALVGTLLHPRGEAPEAIATMNKLILESKRETGAVAEKIANSGDVLLMTEARNRSLALILTAAKNVASGLASIGKPAGPDHRAGLSFLSLDCLDYLRG